MKKNLFFFIGSLLAIAVLTACGGSSDQNNATDGGEDSKGTISASPENKNQEYSQFVIFDKPATVKVDDHFINVEVSPSIKSAAEKINDNSNTELILIDESGAKIASLHPFGRDTSFEDALYSGDTSYDETVTFITSFDSEEEASEVASKAKAYKIIMPLAERPVNEYEDWDPVGVYEMEDAVGCKFTLTIKKGGSAILFNHSLDGESTYSGEKGSWTQSSEYGYLVMDFFNMPFIQIGSHSYVSHPVLTPDYFYHEEKDHPDGACLEVKRVE